MIEISIGENPDGTLNIEKKKTPSDIIKGSICFLKIEDIYFNVAGIYLDLDECIALSAELDSVINQAMRGR